MNQSDKKNLEHMKSFGVNYFLTDSPKNWFETKVSSVKSQNNKNHDNKNNKTAKATRNCEESCIMSFLNFLNKNRVSSSSICSKIWKKPSISIRPAAVESPIQSNSNALWSVNSIL